MLWRRKISRLSYTQISREFYPMARRYVQPSSNKLSTAFLSEGGGTLVLTPGTYLSGSIFLKSGVTLKLEKGAGLLGSPNPYQYMKADVDANGRDARHDNASMALVVAQKCTKFFTVTNFKNMDI